ncbi:MAG TPA: helix-turn-helix transcriptional regulator [Thermoanaerobaculia bacterium]|jgi:transcriptional regulator with XRE-family HTH domain|nr:helix-turn-helix transcriptional regulator [Thermoanaerobaculia bacterium]
MESTARQEADRVIGKLKVAIRLLGYTNREIERRLGYTPSYLTRLFSGQIELRFEHIVDIARAMGLTADEFFAFAYPPRSDQPSEAFQQLNDLLDELRPAPPPSRTPSPSGQLTSKEMSLLIARQLQEILHLNRLHETDAETSGEEPGKTKGRTSRSRKP